MERLELVLGSNSSVDGMQPPDDRSGTPTLVLSHSTIFSSLSGSSPVSTRIGSEESEYHPNSVASSVNSMFSMDRYYNYRADCHSESSYSSEFLSVSMQFSSTGSSRRSSRTDCGKSDYNPNSVASSLTLVSSLEMYCDGRADWFSDFEENGEGEMQSSGQKLTSLKPETSTLSSKKRQKKLNGNKLIKPDFPVTKPYESENTCIPAQSKVGKTTKRNSKKSVPKKEKEAEKVKKTNFTHNELHKHNMKNNIETTKLTRNDVCNSSLNQHHHETVNRRRIRCTTTALSTIPYVQSRACLYTEEVKSPKGFLPDIVPKKNTEQTHEGRGGISVQKKVIRPRKPAVDKLPLIDEHISSIPFHQRPKVKSNGGGLGVLTPTLDRGKQRPDSKNLKAITKHQFIKIKTGLPDDGNVTNPNILADRAQKPPFDTKIDNKEPKRRFLPTLKY